MFVEANGTDPKVPLVWMMDEAPECILRRSGMPPWGGTNRDGLISV